MLPQTFFPGNLFDQVVPAGEVFQMAILGKIGSAATFFLLKN
jgi:hypothetical protein